MHLSGLGERLDSDVIDSTRYDLEIQNYKAVSHLSMAKIDELFPIVRLDQLPKFQYLLKDVPADSLRRMD